MKAAIYVIFATLLAVGTMALGAFGVSDVIATPAYLDNCGGEYGLQHMVVRVLIDNAGTKWFTTSGNEIWRFDESVWITYQFTLDDIPAGRLVDMALDTHDRLWLLFTDGGYVLPQLYCVQGFDFRTVSLPKLCWFPTALTSDAFGHVWVGGWDDGSWVARYDPLWDSWDTWWPDWCDSDLVPRAFATGPDGRVWFQARGYGYRPALYGSLATPDDVGIEFQRFSPQPERNYVDLGITATGTIWLISQPTLEDETPAIIVYGDDAEKWSVLEYPALPYSLAGTCLTTVGDKGIWFGSNRGAFWYDYTDWRWIDIGFAHDIAVDPTNRDVWFGADDGVYVMRGGPEAWPPVWIELEAVAQPCGATPTLSLLGSAEFQMDLRLDLYVALELPDGTLLFAPSWSASMAPLVPNLEVPIGLNVNGLPLVTLEVAGIPAGTYRWYAGCTHAGSMDFASNIASCEWQFE
ncbi:MAG TPA: hypothetical protein VM163_01805 [bacterium]|nr:hypothetical protein [bacterium]